MTNNWDGRVADDGSPQIIFIDSERQALWARVGPVYLNGSSQPHHEPAVWIEYQPAYLGSELSGSILMSPRTWNQFVTAINARLTPSLERRMRRRERSIRSFAVRHLRKGVRTSIS
jgi:hypothetical protein